MISGYAAVFHEAENVRTQFNLGPGFVERMAPGAFDKFLASGRDVVALFNHDMSLVLGRLSAGTLRLRTDSNGLFYEISPAETSVSRDVQAHQKRGDVIGSSLGFRAVAAEYSTEGPVEVRTITEAEIRDVGPVTYPAYSGTEDVDVRMVYSDGTPIPLTEQLIAEQRSKGGYRNHIAERIKVRMRLLDLS